MGSHYYTTVGPGPDCNYADLQTAINHAADGDTIHIEPGTYIGSAVINKKISIETDGKELTIIVGDGVNPALKVTVDGVSIEEVTTTGGGAVASGIYLDNVKHCVVENTICFGNKNGIELVGGEDNDVLKNMCTGNVQYGIKSDASNINEYTDNWTVSNLHGLGIFNSVPVGGFRNVITNHISYLNTGKGLIISNTLGDAVMEYISNLCGIGLSIENCDAVTVGGQVIDHSTTIGAQIINSDNSQLGLGLSVRHSGTTDIFIDAASTSSILLHAIYETIIDLGTGTDCHANHPTIPIQNYDTATVKFTKEWLPTTNQVYVDNKRVDVYVESGSIDRPFKTIQAAINAIAGNSTTNRFQINIAESIYPENLTINKDYVHYVGERWTQLTGNITIAGPAGAGIHVMFSRFRFRIGSVSAVMANHFSIDLRGCDVGAGTTWTVTATAPAGDEWFQTFGGVVQINLTTTAVVVALYESTCIQYASAWNINRGKFFGFSTVINTQRINLNLGCVGTLYSVGTEDGKAGAVLDLNTASTLIADAVTLGNMTITNDGTGVVTQSTAAVDIKNDSTVSGATIKDALNTLVARLLYTALPVASVTYRGVMCAVPGGAGVRDSLYVCLKSDAGVYNWVAIVNGGA